MTTPNLTKLTELLDSAMTELKRIRTELNEVRPAIDKSNQIDKVQPDEPIEPEPVICGYTRSELNEMLSAIDTVACVECKHYKSSGYNEPCLSCVVKGFNVNENNQFNFEQKPIESIEPTCKNCKHEDIDWEDSPCIECKFCIGSQNNFEPK